jgi:hypothetical protein
VILLEDFKDRSHSRAASVTIHDMILLDDFMTMLYGRMFKASPAFEALISQSERCGRGDCSRTQSSVLISAPGPISTPSIECDAGSP